MPVPFTHTLTVAPAAIDAQGHANNVEYVRWMQDAALAAADALDPGNALMHAAAATWVVRTHHVEYVRPALLGDRLAVRTWLSDFTRVSCVRHYEFTRNDEPAVIARGRTDWVFVDAATGRPKRLPPDVRRRIGADADADGAGPAAVG